MIGILFSMVILISYLLVLFIFNTRVSNKIGIMLILIAISVNLDYKVIGNQQVYIHLFFSVMLIMVFALINYSIALRIKKSELSQLNDKRSKYFNIIGIPYIFIIVFLIFQYNLVEIYDLNLFLHHLTVFLTLFLMLIWFYLTSKNSNNEQSNIIIFKSILIFSVLNALLSVMQYVYNKSFLPSAPTASIDYLEGIKVTKRVWGFVGSSNGAGNLGAILFAVLLYYLYKKRNLLVFIAFLLNLVFVLLTLTRIAYVAIFVEFFIFICFVYFKDLNYRKLFFRFGLTILFVLVTLISIYTLYDRAYELLVLDRGATGSNRFIQFNKVMEIIRDHLVLGVGAGQYVYNAAIHYGFRDIVVHSQFLNVLVEQGIFSFFAYLVVYINLFLILIKKFKRDIWFPIILFIGNFITSNFNPNQYYTVSIFIFMFIVLGLVFYRNDATTQSTYEN